MDRLLISLLNTGIQAPDALESPLGTARWWAGLDISVDGRPRFDARLSSAIRELRASLAARADGEPAAVGCAFRGDASDAILFELLHAARTAIADGSFARARRCANPACARYFADETKNGSKRWCSLRCMERARAPRRRTISR